MKRMTAVSAGTLLAACLLGLAGPAGCSRDEGPRRGAGDAHRAGQLSPAERKAIEDLQQAGAFVVVDTKVPESPYVGVVWDAARVKDDDLKVLAGLPCMREL